VIAQIEAFKGIDNVAKDRRIQRYQFGDDAIIMSGDLKTCVNFRITSDGIATVRNGLTRKRAPIGTITTLWVSSDGNTCLLCDGTSLKLLNSDYTLTTKYAISAERDMAFTESLDGYIYMGNGHNMLTYKDATAARWGDIASFDSGYTKEYFEAFDKKYNYPPNSDIILAYYDHIYVAYDRYVFFSEDSYGQRFRSAWHLVAPETVTALSNDDNCLYVHTYNWTVPFVGRGPSDFFQMDAKRIGAIKHFPCIPKTFIGAPIWMSKEGWAMGQGGQVKRVDSEHFELDMGDTAKCYTGYDPVNKELIASIRE
jgi:hypothetical protein